MTGGFRAPPPHDLPPARFLTSARIGAWLGVLRRFDQLSGAMRMWMLDARQQLVWRETNQPRVISTKVAPGKQPLTFRVDDSLADVQTDRTPAFDAWEHWLETGEADE